MSTVLVPFAKTPSLSPVKTRLAEAIGTEKAETFYRMSLDCMKRTLNQVDHPVVWAVGERNGKDKPFWSEQNTEYTGPGGLGERQYRIYTRFLSVYDSVVLLGTDSPQITPSLLDKAIETLDDRRFVVGPASDGGYYLFGGRDPVSRQLWTSVSWSTGRTLKQFSEELSSKPVELPMRTDVDRVSDLKGLLREMPAVPTEEQQRLMNWVQELQSPPPSTQN